MAEHIFSDTVSLQFLIQFSFHSFSVAREEISLTQLFPLAQKTDVIFKKIRTSKFLPLEILHPSPVNILVIMRRHAAKGIFKKKCEDKLRKMARSCL